MTKKSLISLFALTFASSSSLLGIGLTDTPDKIEKTHKVRQSAENPLERVAVSNLLEEVVKPTEIRGDAQIYPTQTGNETHPSLQQGSKKQEHALKTDFSFLALVIADKLGAPQTGLNQLPQNDGLNTSSVNQSLEALSTVEPAREVYHWRKADYGTLCEILESINGYTISVETLAKKLNEVGVECTKNSMKSRLTRIKQGKIGSSKIGVEHYDELLELLKAKVYHRPTKKK